MLPRGNFLSSYWMPIIDVILLGLTLYVAVFRILNWNFLEIWLDARIQRLPAIFRIPQPNILAGQESFIIWTTQYTRITQGEH